jgi:O-antigen/teichoic acid export membrane protein
MIASLISTLRTFGAAKASGLRALRAASGHVGALLPAHALRARIARGAFWLLVGASAARIASVVTSIIVARSLGVAQFGAFGVVQNTTAVFAAFAGMGLGLTATKYVAEYRDTEPERAGEIIFFATRIAIASGLVMMFLLLLAAPFLARYALAAPQLTGALRVSAAGLLFAAASGAQLGALAGLEAFQSLGMVTCISNLTLLGTTAGGVVLFGLPGAIWGSVLGAGLAVLISQKAVVAATRKNGIVPSGSHFRSQVAIIRNFSVPAVIGGIMTGSAGWACTAVLVNMAGYKEMGIFNSSNYWRQAILFLPATIGYSLLPVLSSINAKGDARGFKRVFLIGILLNMGLALMVGLPIAIFAKAIMRAYGRGFEDGARVLLVIALAGGVISVNNHLSRVAAALGRMWLSFRFDLCWSVASLGLSVLLIPRYGALGLALAALGAALIQFGYQITSLPSVGLRVRQSSAGESPEEERVPLSTRLENSTSAIACD